MRTQSLANPLPPLRNVPAGAIEWEELPSLADSLAQRLVLLGTRNRDALSAARARAAAYERAVGSGQPWDATRPAELEPSRASEPFREPLHGMAVREVQEPDVFRHFFGTLGAAAPSR